MVGIYAKRNVPCLSPPMHLQKRVRQLPMMSQSDKITNANYSGPSHLSCNKTMHIEGYWLQFDCRYACEACYSCTGC
jgi:hypothetical protein